jgi:hypothetical protein
MSTYNIPLVNNNKPQMSDLGWFADIQFDTSDAAPIYIGLNVTKGASDLSTDWKIYKFTYSGSDVTRIQLAYGSWTGRASLF